MVIAPKTKAAVTPITSAYGEWLRFPENVLAPDPGDRTQLCKFLISAAFDLHTRELVRFRLKGFKNFFLTHIKPKYQFLDGDFIALVSVIEQAIQIFGDHFCADRARIEAYRRARKMAHEDHVALEPLAA